LKSGPLAFFLSGGGGKWEFAEHLEAKRNTQLDGWRAFGVVGVMWHHWAPKAWRGPFPFEIGLFFFLTLTGFLITRILLREKAAGESMGTPWRTKAYGEFQKRRLVRILVPCYAAMGFAIVVGASDICAHPLVYFGHVSNFHMAWMAGWPPGTAHYWTLALQMQFYAFWPLLVFCVPRRSLGWVFLVCVLLAPVTRLVVEREFPSIQHGGVITTAAFDYFGVGALLALALESGIKAGDRRIAIAGWIALAGYVTLYVISEAGLSAAGLGYFQQTLLSVAMVGLISATLGGLGGLLGKLLEHPAVQHVGRLSYGLYLFHAPVPLFLGHVLSLMWWPAFDHGPLLALRLGVFALTSWGLAWLCWRWLEGPERLQFLQPAGRGESKIR
jgi:peptidoglycan/LPS O-acetylase OafA/YrhL